MRSANAGAENFMIIVWLSSMLDRGIGAGNMLTFIEKRAFTSFDPFCS